MAHKQIVLAAMCVVVLRCVDAQLFPSNPCPDLFQYFRDNGVVYGRMEFPNDYSGLYRLSANMSVAAYLTDNKNIKLELRTSANDLSVGRSVVYHVYFPIQDVIPKPTRIEFNRRVYCAGPPEQLRPGGGVTNMWATTYFGIGRPVRPDTANEIEIVEAVPQFSFTLPTVPPSPWITKSPIAPPVSFTAPTRPPPASTQSTTTTPANFFINIGAPFTSATRNPTAAPPKQSKPFNAECGISSVNSQQLVVNGEKVQDGQYPWMVAIMYRQNFDYKYRCTGSLVSDRHVITAGHCVQFFKAPLIPIEDLLLVFGKINIQNWANGAVLRDVRNMTVHPEYKQNKGDCDIAVLTLDKPIEFGPSIRPVCLWQGSNDLDLVVDKQGTVVGWGMDGTGSSFVPEATKVSLPVVSQVMCLRSDPGFTGITSSRTFCAGKQDGSGPCNGDSGAGFVMNRDGKWALRGVVSTALGDASTCDLDNYFVFADAAKVDTWLRQAMV